MLFTLSPGPFELKTPIVKKRQQRRQWLEHEDELLRELVSSCGQDWTIVSAQIPTRTGKQCRER